MKNHHSIKQIQKNIEQLDYNIEYYVGGIS